MTITIPEVDEIYFSKTKAYFKEVLSSYSNGNYRSAVVMLYSVTICDILFKLQELKDVYNDTIAIEILDLVEKTQTNSKSKSSWEKTLIDNVRDKTQLLDLQAYSDLVHLYDDRNLSAHPAMTQDYELISPSQETTIAHIKNILNEILVKPPIFIKNIIDVLSEDLKRNGDGYTNAALKTYLQKKYYSKMTETMKKKVFRTLWKFCFKMSDNQDCIDNIKNNWQAIYILTTENPNLFAETIREDQAYFTIDNNDTIKFKVVDLFSKQPILYSTISETTKAFVDNYIRQNINTQFGAWFQFKSLKQHLKFLSEITEKGVLWDVSENTINYVIDKYKLEGYLQELVDLFVKIYGNSRSYADADRRFELFIKPILNNMISEQFKLLISLVSQNNQIYGRNAAFNTNTEIVSYAIKKLPNDFKFSDYENFKYDETVVTKEHRNIDNNFDTN